MMKFKKLIIFYVFLDVLLIFVAASFGEIQLLNSQVAMIASMIILFGSYQGYKSRVQNRSLNYELSETEKAIFEDIKEDDEMEDDPKNLSKQTKFRKVDIIGAFKPYRLIGYITLILAFFMLLRKDLFEPFSFLIGLAVMPIGVFLAGVFTRER
ncbi:hypothetical protein [Campylobacter hyointestinalis]|uniref:hypothetical protein n=2 Tax=Campylobacter hyointestinalis TaxID=198 RepID=UPI0007C8BD2D|nr:hypothetical protein [Campylobacter hyointestinalis]MDL2347511.1 hypothetical protein [Campylobacter hyointestinalis]MDL2349271.1 hypothetical protein [Campylobacter hyointestinalis]MDM1026831.1 hypothetical protein [Campylobacter hyointestinalis]QKF55428.1 putative membrane protein [Campylobacter hyointestinalis subsp. hyointestinalis]TXK47225.1 hypothetical protein A0Z69_04245 [Campylobacter hyointestinalis]